MKKGLRECFSSDPKDAQDCAGGWRGCRKCARYETDPDLRAEIEGRAQNDKLEREEYLRYEQEEMEA